MSGYSMGPRAVYAAQEDSVYLDRSVWTAWFYVHLLDVLDHDTWREYSTEAYGRPCRFEMLRDFLSHEDGLRWRSVDETLGMMELVRDCPKKLEPERDAPADETLQQYARKTLEALSKRGVTRQAEAATAALAQPLAPVEIGVEGGKPGPGRGNKTVADSHGLRPASRLSSDSQERILRRLARDAPEILERVKAGEFRSARAAAIEAGIIRPVPTVRLVGDHAKVAASIRKHLSPEQIRYLCDELLSTLN